MSDLICDANSLYARSWFAAQTISTDPQVAVRLVMNTLIKILQPSNLNTHFTRTLFGWDCSQNPKKDRTEKPPEYHTCKEILKEILEYVFNSINVEVEGYEGDDIVGTAAALVEPNPVYIVSGDKDLMQLYGEHTFYYCLNSKAVLSEAFMKHKLKSYGIQHPNQLALALAVVGDAVDNIKGIRGWGPKKCHSLFEAVSPSMDFEEAYQAILKQIPEDRQNEFFESLERTLLDLNVPGVPEPSPLILARPEDFEELGLPELNLDYDRLYNVYSRVTSSGSGSNRRRRGLRSA